MKELYTFHRYRLCIVNFSIFLFFCICFSFTNYTFSQNPTLKETQDWIENTIENNEYESSGPGEYYIRRYNSISFTSDGKLYIDESKFVRPSMTNTYTSYILQIKYLKSLKFREELDMVIFQFEYRDDIDVRNKYILMTEKDQNQNIKNKENLVGFGIIVSKNILKDDLASRLIKAFDHLIKLNGGKVVKDVF